MQTRNLAIIILMIMSSNSFSQEMFNNGGFEIYTSCPTGWDQTLKIVGCTSRNNTPEYYNCSYGSANAYNGTGCLYLGAIRNGMSTYVQEGVNLQLSTPLTSGVEYRVSVYVKYKVTVWSDPSFDYGSLLTCFNLRFSFGTTDQFGRPTIFQAELDGGAVYGSGNNIYHLYSFTFTPTQNYSYLYISNSADNLNTSAYNNIPCQSAGARAYVFDYFLDDLSIIPSAALPIKLTSFNAISNNNTVELNWETLTEINNDYFVIERSADGINYSNIGHVDGNGDSQETISYKYNDDSPLSGISYYRLKQVDFNGSYTYSRVAVINHHQDTPFVVYPNPSNGLFYVNYSGEYNISIVNIQGKIVFTKSDTSNKTKINLTELPNGMYWIRLNSKQGTNIQKFIKQ